VKILGNILWLILCGLWLALLWFVVGIIECITIIGIPFGLQSFKLAKLALWPFGKTITHGDGAGSTILNILWLLFGGLIISLLYFIYGIVFHITIIGIPFGKQCFKLGKLALRPFGATIQDESKPLNKIRPSTRPRRVD